MLSFVSRKTLLIALLAVLTQTGAIADEKPERIGKYRVIFNCDGHAVFKDARGDTAQWLKNLFEPLEDSHVDALFWCDGAGGNTSNYDSHVLELNGKRVGSVAPHLAKRRKIDVFYSFRINDIHDTSLRLSCQPSKSSTRSG